MGLFFAGVSKRTDSMKRILERLSGWGVELIQRLIVAVAPVCVQEELDCDRKQALPLSDWQITFIADFNAPAALEASVLHHECQPTSGRLSKPPWSPPHFWRSLGAQWVDPLRAWRFSPGLCGS